MMDSLSLETLQLVWFSVFVLLVTGYVVLDGFDLGVGILHLFSTKDEERRLMLNSIGPVWDGNEVWLVTAGGALLAGFPPIYATLCSSFYTPLMLFLSGILFRAVAIEFRSKQPMSWWRWMWDLLFTLASLVIAFALGVVMGNLIRGIPIDAQGEFTGSLIDLIHPYAILVGVMTVALFMMHGAIYLMMKTEGAFHEKMRAFLNPCIIFFIISYALTTMATLIYQPHMSQALQERPLFFLVAVCNMLLVANIPRMAAKGRDGWAFLSSSGAIACLMALYAIGMYPTVIRPLAAPEEHAMTLYNSSSSLLTLKILLLFALIGAPLVIGYTSIIYYIFRGKVKLDAHSY